MNFRWLIILFLSAISLASFSQASSYTKLDTAKINERKAKKISGEYWYHSYYDSISGKPNGRVDTNYAKYDVTGRLTEQSSVLDEGERFTVYLFYNQQGQLTRKLSCNGDSTDGIIDTWDYDTLGRVVHEKTFMRNPEGDESFRTREFQYDSLNRLVLQVDTYASDKNGSRSQTVQVKYSGHFIMKCDLHANGDTSSVDTTFKFGGYYWSRIYFYRTQAYSNVKMKQLSSSYTMSVDTITFRNKTRKTTIIRSESYIYRIGSESDTIYQELNNRIISRRGVLYTDDYTYNRKGELDYMLRKNRKGQLIYRRTKSYTYYQ